MKKLFIIITTIILVFSLSSCSNWGEWKIVKEPTCTTDGMCVRIDKSTGETEKKIIPATGHNETIIEGTPATCTIKGLTDGIKCSICNKILKEQEKINATGHDFYDWEIITSPSCYEEGLKRRNCKFCEIYEEESIPKTHSYEGGACKLCDSLQSEGLKFTLLDNNTYMVSCGTCDDAEIIIPDYYKNKKVTTIEQGGFNVEFNLRSVILGQNIITIKSGAFSSCNNLTNVSFNDKLQSIEAHAFWGTGLTGSISLPNSVTSIGKSAFYSCKIIEFNTGNGLTEIAETMFNQCTQLKKVTLGNNVKCTLSSAFSGCSNLTTINFPNCFEKIGPYSFSGCSSLTTIHLPSTLNNILNGAFNNCKKLTAIYYNSSYANWKNIPKGIYWDNNIGEYTLYCNDATIRP